MSFLSTAPGKAIALSAFILALATVDAPSVEAQSRDEYLDKLVRCDSIDKRSQRKACIQEVLREMRGERSSSTWRGDAKDSEKRYSQKEAQEYGGKSNAKSPRGSFNAGLVSIRKSVTGRHYFLLDNGQVWREKKSTRLPYISPNTKRVTVKPGTFGGWRMTFDTSKARASVELVE